MTLNPNNLYKILLNRFDNPNWWPIDIDYHKKNHTDPRFEIIVGTILTQNTSWSNVEKALLNLKLKKNLDIKNIPKIKNEKLQNMIKPSGFFKQKTIRLKKIALYINEKYNGNLDDFFNRNLYTIRDELLSINGIGEETADSILLYAGNLPIFVVDKYTKRICERLYICETISYKNIQEYFENELSKKYSQDKLSKVYNEFHALIVIFAKEYCKKNPKCKNCIIKKNCNFNLHHDSKL
jgi:endonuclease-3 related protein